MATWINHLRIAEYFMNKIPQLDNLMFLVGNIAPDCGVPNRDHSAFSPDKSITHWKVQNADGEIDADRFRQNYLQSKDENYPFYLGYFFHLITDIEWEKLFHVKKQESLYIERINSDNNFIWELKREWYGLDCIYLKEHKDFIYHTSFCKIKDFPNVYLDYYPKDAFERQIRYIKKFYMLLSNRKDVEFQFFSREENEKFVKQTISKLESIDIY